MVFCHVFVMPLCTSVYLYLVVTYCYLPIGILGQVWYLIVSIPDLCTHPDRYSNIFLNAYINRHVHAKYLKMI